MNKEHPLIRLTEISKVYCCATDKSACSTNFAALRNINLVVKHGEYISVIGQSGSGKSTLLHILGCLMTPTSGSYLLNGREVSQLPDNDLANVRNQAIGFVFQNFNLLPRLTVLDNVALPLAYRHGISAKQRNEMAAAMLDRFGFMKYAARYPCELSGGEQQKVAIARALVTNPDLILADEPTGNLDTKSGMNVIELLEYFWQQGKTIIVVTHNMQISPRAKRMIKIQDGQILE